MKKVYVTKYALTHGVELCTVDTQSEGYTYVKRPGHYKTQCRNGKDCFDTRAEAYQRVLVMVAAKKKSLAGSITRMTNIGTWAEAELAKEQTNKGEPK